jgi:prepilin-type N-terminal cleavage/methylation domain-containing protein
MAHRELDLTERIRETALLRELSQRTEGHIHMENKQDKGFTLVELLIVIVILGILATVTVFAVRGITDRGSSSACAADKKTLQVAVEAYIAQNGTAGLSEAALVPIFLVAQSTNYDIAATAPFAVTAVPNNTSGCT